MKIHYMIVAIIAIGFTSLTACSLFRWSGYYRHDDTFPQLHYDWSKQPYFPSPDVEEKPIELKFPETKAEHAEAEKRFLTKAKQYRMDAKAHREMSRRYSDNPELAAHCLDLSTTYEGLAEKMEEFAAWHKTHSQKAMDLENEEETQ